MTLRIPHSIIWDDRLPASDKDTVDELNAALARLNEMRAVEINIAGPFLRSKIAWKLATYQHALLHRTVALMDGVAVAWNHQATLSAMLSARALMETFAIFYALDTDVTKHLAAEDLERLDTIAQRGTFASRDTEWIKEHPETQAVNVLTFVDRFDKHLAGFRGHYDRLSERCHPNSLGHHFMFSSLDTKEGTVSYSDETHPEGNAQSVLAAISPLPLVENIMVRLDKSILAVSDLQHRISPVVE